MRNFDENKILDLCKSFKYERMEMDQVVFLQGSVSNDKVYVILSGEVAVINGKNTIGEFGESEAQLEKRSNRALRIKKGPKILIHSSEKDLDTRRLTPVNESKKRTSAASARDTDRKSPSLRSVPRISVKDVDALSDRSIGRDDSAAKLSSRSNNSATKKTPEKPEILTRKPTMTSGIKKMRAFVRMVTTVSGMKKAATKKQGNAPADSAPKKEVGTLQYLDKEDNEESEESDNEDNKEFEEYASRFGKIIRYLGKGENFGELALKRNTLRSATILCKTDCEFLVLERAQYDLVFGKVQKEKEEFLRAVFPSLSTNIASTDNFNYLVYFFKAKSYLRGQYIVKEGEVPLKEAKFYVIQQGECVLERHFTRELANPFNRTKALMATSESVIVAKLGKGSLIGEEILETQNVYEYSVRAVSDNVLVQAISRRDFKLRFPKDFRESIQNTCKQKRTYREAAFEKAKQKAVAKEDQFKNENIYCLQNANMNDLISRSAAQGLSRQIQRENNVHRIEDPIFKSILPSPRSERQLPSSGALRTIQCLDEYERRKSIDQSSKFVTPRVKSGSMEIDNIRPKSQDEKLYAKLEFLSKMPKTKKLSSSEADLGLLPHNKFVFHEKKSDSKRSTFNLTSKKLNSNSKDSSSISQEKFNTSASILRSRLHIKDRSSDGASLRYLHKTPSPVPESRTEFNLSEAIPKTDRPSSNITPSNISEAPAFPSPRGISRTFRRAMTKKKIEESGSDYFFITAPGFMKKRGSEVGINTGGEDTNELLQQITAKHSLSNAKKKSEDVFNIIARQTERRKTLTENGLLSECLMYRPMLTQRSSKSDVKDSLQLLFRESNSNKENLKKQDDIIKQIQRNVKKIVVKNLKIEKGENFLKV